MKSFIVVALLASLCGLSQARDKLDVCHSHVEEVCGPSLSAFSGEKECHARYDGIDHIEESVQGFINLQLRNSYEYLLLATHFNSYTKNRPGFQKLYQGLSDRLFDESIDLMKQLTRRGGVMDFTSHLVDYHPSGPRTLEVDELHSLAMALDNEKRLANAASHVHTLAAHTKIHDHEVAQAKAHIHDPEMAHYFEEKFLGKQAENVRKLSGYANDLAKLMTVPNPSLSVHLFDEYLEKQ